MCEQVLVNLDYTAKEKSSPVIVIESKEVILLRFNVSCSNDFASLILNRKLLGLAGLSKNTPEIYFGLRPCKENVFLSNPKS